ncbi:MAG: ribonuclease HI family protein [Armatimonadota bacterium]
MSRLAVHTDGACKGNPGPAGIGVVLASEDGTVIREIAEYIGDATNNTAEYLALIRGLEAALELGADSVEINVDSELVARQLAGVYRVKSGNLAPLHERALSLLRRFRNVSIGHVVRQHNKRADELANEAIKNQRRSIQCT